jgi:hypothetical protein
LVEKHLIALNSHNLNGKFDTLLAETKPLYAAFMASITNKSNTGTSGKTLATSQALDDIQDYIVRKEGVIADKFDRKSVVYTEFFPKGRKEFSTATKSTINLIVKRFISVATKYSNEVGADIAAEVGSLLDKYNTLRNDQLETIGMVKSFSGEGRQSREVLAQQLYKNLLTLILEDHNDTEHVKLYFDEAFTKKGKGTNPSPEKPTA